MDTTNARSTRPDRDEYGDYYRGYVERVPDGDVLETLARQRTDLARQIDRIPESRGDYRYVAGKWSVKEVLGHLVDAERILGVRALAFARGDSTPLPGFDQDAYVAAGDFDRRTVADLAAELDALRASHLALFASFDAEAWQRGGTASDCPFTTRALAWIMAGHVMHHVAVLEERYLER